MNWPQWGVETATTCYVISVAAYLLSLNRWLRSYAFLLEKVAKGSLLLGFILAVLSLLHEGILVTNEYNAFIFLSGAILTIHRLFNRKKEWAGLNAMVVFLALFSLGYAQWFDRSDLPMPPMGRSRWFVAHSTLQFLSYGFLSVSFVAVFSYWISRWKRRMDEKEMKPLLLASHKTLVAGFLFLTGSIVSGIISTRRVYGSYWGWEPNEVLILALWCILAIYLYLCKKSALLSR
jgi:ABC-type transport system involved in cytochrome c biogenesis permease subunit